MSPISTQLEDDIALMAALRGQTPEQAAEAHRQLVNAKRRDALSPARIAGLFVMMADPARDLSVYDRLPAASRAFMRDETKVHICATKWREALMLCGDEPALLAAARAFIAQNLRNYTKRSYGPGHPDARDAR